MHRLHHPLQPATNRSICLEKRTSAAKQAAEKHISRPESSQEHLPTSIAGVLRLRAMKPSVCDRSAKRFAQDDGFVGGLKYSWLDMQLGQAWTDGGRFQADGGPL
jgi:hypothetical protein